MSSCNIIITATVHAINSTQCQYSVLQLLLVFTFELDYYSL